MHDCCHAQDDQAGHTCSGDCTCQHDSAPALVAVPDETAAEHTSELPDQVA